MPSLSRLFAAGVCALAAASAVHAQSRLHSVPNRTQSPSTTATQSAPRPAGLNSAFPAGLNSGSGAAVSSDPVAASTAPRTFGPAVTTAPAPGTVTSLPPTNPAVPPAELPSTDINTAATATTIMGAAGATVRGPSQSTGGAGGFNATDVARSFFFADANHDGLLTRAEAGRLSIATLTFEEMDRNFDNLISRFEYEDSLR